MKVFHVTLTAAAAILCLAGCNKEFGRDNEAGIIVNATIGNLTKVNNDGISTSFTEGDKISVYGWTGSGASVPNNRCVDGVTNTLGSDGSWTPEEKMVWQSQSADHYFLGIFPPRKITGFTADPYVLDPSDYTGSDLLVATNLSGVTAKDGPVDLMFRHAMAKIVVNLKFGNDWDATPAVTGVSVQAKTAADIDYLGTPLVSAKGDESDVSLAASASAPDGFAYSFSGLQVPQDGVRKISILIGKNEYVYEAAGTIPLVSGKITTIGLAVIDKFLVEVGNVTLSDWADGADLPGGAANLPSTKIEFHYNNYSLESAFVKNLKVNINHDNYISTYEASVVRSLEDLFGDQLYNGANYNSFDEFKYFTGITTIPAGSFKNWNNITSITLPDSITKIEGGDGTIDGPFINCPKLESIKGKFTVDDKMLVYNKTLLKVAETAMSITIPQGVETIGANAFYKSNAATIIIPSSVQTIRKNAFYYLLGESVYFKGETPPTVDPSAFANTTAQKITIYVPAVMNGTTVDTDATNARIAQFETALGMGTGHFKFQYYTE